MPAAGMEGWDSRPYHACSSAQRMPARDGQILRAQLIEHTRRVVLAGAPFGIGIERQLGLDHRFADIAEAQADQAQRALLFPRAAEQRGKMRVNIRLEI